MKKSLLLVCLFFTSVLMYSQTLINKITPANNYDIAYEVWELDNGLTIIVHEDDSDPMVHVEVPIMLVLTEQQVLQALHISLSIWCSFDNVGDDEHFKIISESGGTANGTTNRDRTNYFETVPSNQLETALWLEADRMGFVRRTVKKFENQRDAVKNEKMHIRSMYHMNVFGTKINFIHKGILFMAYYRICWWFRWVTVDDLKTFLRWYGQITPI